MTALEPRGRAQVGSIVLGRPQPRFQTGAGRKLVEVPSDLGEQVLALATRQVAELEETLRR